MHRFKILVTSFAILFVLGLVLFGPQTAFAGQCCGNGTNSCGTDANPCNCGAGTHWVGQWSEGSCQSWNPDPPPPANPPTPTIPATCPYPNLAIQTSADGVSWGSSADTVRGANGYTKRYYRIQSSGSNIINAQLNAPITMKWEKTATTGGGAVRVVDTFTTTSTVTSLKHNPICSLIASGNYFMCETPVGNRTENIGDTGDFKYTVSSPACTASVATFKITAATQATSCPTQGVRLEYSSDKVTWRQYGQYFMSNTGSSSQMCARVVDVASGAVLDRDYLEERWWAPPPPSTFTDANASSRESTNALTGGWVPWKNNTGVYENGCWTPTSQRTAGVWTGEARYFGLNTCASKAASVIGVAATCRENNLPLFKIFGDANGDCEIDLINDFVQFIREKMGVLTTKDADFNNSGSVDSSDFAIWKIGYQTFKVR